MLEAYIAVGFAPDGFWPLTPKLYQLHMNGAAERAKIDRVNRAWLAWNTAFLPAAKKAPKFEDLAGIRPRRPANDPDRVRAFHSAWDRIDRALERGRERT